ncbi:MAG: ATP-dependent zinc metalloprotease FtsH [Eubacterium sp.]|nr:ATP-dependent zinc metalloprotease FtsH [Eubacterium sp.]
MEDNNQNNNNNNNNNNKKPGGYNTTIGVIIITLILSIIFIMVFNNYKASGEEEKSYDEFIQMLEDGNVKNVEIYEKKIKFVPIKEDKNYENITYYVIRTDDYQLIDRLDKANVEFTAINEGGNAILAQVLYYVIFFAVMYFLTMMLFRRISSSGGGFMNVGKSNAKLYDMTKNTGVTFSDVAGEEEAKESLTEMVDFLKNPQKYLEIGARLPKGALLVGPPGTGKTLLAKAVAGEAGVPFFSMSGSEFVEMYVGVGASRVRDLFKQANAKAPCIIFIDEIDAIGRSRDTRHMGGDSEREQTLNQLLSEMDGFDSSKGIIILAATNRPEVLDKALLRPGRFDRRVVVERPDLKGREDILKVHSKDVKLDETVDLHELASVTSGSVGADLENIINEAALTAVRKGRRFVSQSDLIESVEVVFAGKEKKDRILSADEKSIVAYHEAGHALLTMLQKNTMPVQKITIVPRTMGALGYVWQTPEEEKYLETQAEMEAHIVITMGGRAAEAIKFPSVTSGASNDIEQATKEARAMVTMYGMSERFGMVQLEGITGEYLDRRAVMQCSDETATMIDDEVRIIIKNAYDRAYKILSENVKILDAIATYLIDHESITGKEFVDIFNQVTGGVFPVVDMSSSLTSDRKQWDRSGKLFLEHRAELPYSTDGNGKRSGAKAYGKSGKYVSGEDYSASEDSELTSAEKAAKKAAKKAKKEKAKAEKALKEKDKASKKANKVKVFASPEFEARREQLLNENESVEVVLEKDDSSKKTDILAKTDSLTVSESEVTSGLEEAPASKEEFSNGNLTSENISSESYASADSDSTDNDSTDTSDSSTDSDNKMPWDN